jgi:4a-hydroxytetrahydrobiopterin dehydratase
MTKLATESCVACRPDAPAVTATEMKALKTEVPHWAVVEREGIARLERVFRFANFAEALAFTNRVGALAESADHHPAITTEWGRVTVGWWTHAIGGLHRNDFIMAAKTDQVA